MRAISELERWGREGQEFKAIFVYIANESQPGIRGTPVSKNKINPEQIKDAHSGQVLAWKTPIVWSGLPMYYKCPFPEV